MSVALSPFAGPSAGSPPAPLIGAAPYRVMPVGDAIATAYADLARLGITIDMETFPGETFSTQRCTLRAADGRVVGRSTGKGLGAQSLASALFEAIELYFTAADQNRLSVDTDDVAIVSARELGSQEALAQDLVIQRLAQRQPQAGVGCLRMRELGSARPVWYPLALTDPGYPLHPLPGDTLEAAPSLRRYCTSSGTAAGITVDEALAHALCEWIEYDAISQAMLRWFVTGQEKPAIVAPETVPAPLDALIEQISGVVGPGIVLIDITTDLGMPSFLAVPFTPYTPAALWGAGAAPDPVYAAERALTELLQTSTIYHGDRAHHEHSHQRMLGRLAAWPPLRAACRCDVSSLFNGQRPSHVPFPERPAGLPAAPEELVARVLRLLADRGFPCLVAPLNHTELTTQVLAVRVPGLDRFGGQVIAGYPALPTGRAMALWPGGAGG